MFEVCCFVSRGCSFLSRAMWLRKVKSTVNTNICQKDIIQIMDLNVIIFEREFANEKVISSKVLRAINDGFKRIALSVVITSNNIANIPVPPSCAIKSTVPDVRILSRLTVKVEETVHFYQISKCENLKYYDLLAIEPQNEKMLSYINNGNFDCDLMSFNFSDLKIVNALKRANFSLPLSKGIGMEINYTDCLSSASQRRQAIACGQMLVDKTNAKNIILSSGTLSLIANGKSPRDVIYIGLLFGLNEFQGKQATFRNGAKVIKHAELRKNIIASSIEVLESEMEGVKEEQVQASPKGIKRLVEEEIGGNEEIAKRQKITQ